MSDRGTIRNHRYVGGPEEVCDCEPTCLPACCDDTEERLETTIASQSARIAELEAELKALSERFYVSSLAISQFESERDAVRKALFWALTSCRVTTCSITVEATGAVFPTGDGTPAGFEAALLAAAREGGEL